MGSLHFTLLPVIMEYITNKLVEQMGEEINTEKFAIFMKFALMKAQAKDYIRDIQIRLIRTPLENRLLATFGKDGTEKKLRAILSRLREMSPQPQGYAAGNILNLLVGLQSNLRGYNFSSLKIRQAYLQGVELREVNFAQADFEQPVFTDTFGSILSVAFSLDGKQLAAGTANGEIRLWKTADGSPQLTYQGHTQWVFALDFHPTKDILASGSGYKTIRLWEASTGKCLNIMQGHSAWVRSVAFSPDGNHLVSCSEDETICLWDVGTGQCIHTLRGHGGRVRSVAFSPDG